MSFTASQIDLEIITLSEVSHSEKDISCMWNLKKQNNRLTDKENNCIVSKVLRQSGGINQELRINIYTLLYIKYIAFNI